MTKTLPTETCEGRKYVIDVFLFYFELQKKQLPVMNLLLQGFGQVLLTLGQYIVNRPCSERCLVKVTLSTWVI